MLVDSSCPTGHRGFAGDRLALLFSGRGLATVHSSSTRPIRLIVIRDKRIIESRMALMPPMTVVETEEFVHHSKAILTETERDALVAHLGANPETGQLVPGTGGVRKIRWASGGHGKRGGARVIYYYYNQSIPMFLLDIYAKNEKANLSQADKRSLKRLLPMLVSRYMKRS